MVFWGLALALGLVHIPPHAALSLPLPPPHVCTGQITLGQVVLSVLLEFWLTDVTEPVPADTPLPGSGSASVYGTAASPVR